MLRSLRHFSGFTLDALDAEIGRCKDFLLDDRDWVIRYMVADTHKWLPGGRKVVISPVSLQQANMQRETIPVSLTRGRVENSPMLAHHAPVSRQYEISYFNYYGYGYYWMGPKLWGATPYPISLAQVKQKAPFKAELAKENHLRSVKQIMGYRIQTDDDQIGHAHDFIVDDNEWTVPYMAIDTRN